METKNCRLLETFLSQSNRHDCRKWNRCTDTPRPNKTRTIPQVGGGGGEGGGRGGGGRGGGGRGGGGGGGRGGGGQEPFCHFCQVVSGNKWDFEYTYYTHKKKIEKQIKTNIVAFFSCLTDSCLNFWSAVLPLLPPLLLLLPPRQKKRKKSWSFSLFFPFLREREREIFFLSIGIIIFFLQTAKILQGEGKRKCGKTCYVGLHYY